jgi:hypothetical protein
MAELASLFSLKLICSIIAIVIKIKKNNFPMRKVLYANISRVMAFPIDISPLLSLFVLKDWCEKMKECSPLNFEY